MAQIKGTPIEQSFAPVGTRMLARQLPGIGQTAVRALPGQPIAPPAPHRPTPITEVVIRQWSPLGDHVALEALSWSAQSGSLETGWHQAHTVLMVEVLERPA